MHLIYADVPSAKKILQCENFRWKCYSGTTTDIQDSQERTAWIGQQGHYSQDWTARTELSGHDCQDRTFGTDCQDRTARTQDCQDRTARTELPEQDCKERTARTGLSGVSGQDCQVRTARNGQAERSVKRGQDSQDINCKNAKTISTPLEGFWMKRQFLYIYKCQYFVIYPAETVFWIWKPLHRLILR
jgi:hypothetical protein